jgi:hypothetical protein
MGVMGFYKLIFINRNQHSLAWIEIRGNEGGRGTKTGGVSSVVMSMYTRITANYFHPSFKLPVTSEFWTCYFDRTWYCHSVHGTRETSELK